MFKTLNVTQGWEWQLHTLYLVIDASDPGTAPCRHSILSVRSFFVSTLSFTVDSSRKVRSARNFEQAQVTLLLQCASLTDLNVDAKATDEALMTAHLHLSK